MFDILDSLLATAAVVLGLSLIVQAIQQIIKQWLDLKSSYMRIQLLAMFDSPVLGKAINFSGLWNVSSLSERAGSTAKQIVAQLENIMGTFGYKNLDILENMKPEKLKEIINTITWPDSSINLEKIKKDIDTWLEIAQKGFQNLYERRMKLWAFMISAVVVIVMNANVFEVYKEFSTNQTLRDAANTWLEKTVAQPRDVVIVNVKTDKFDTVNVIRKTDDQLAKEIKENITLVKSTVSEQSFQIFRWSKPYRDALFSASSSIYKNWIKTLLGWLGMTLLVSLGSPFWYDILKAIMGLKNKAKPSE